MKVNGPQKRERKEQDVFYVNHLLIGMGFAQIESVSMVGKQKLCAWCGSVCCIHGHCIDKDCLVYAYCKECQG